MATSKTTKKTAVKKVAKKTALTKAPTKSLRRKFNDALDKQPTSTVALEKNVATGKHVVTKTSRTAPKAPTKPALPASQTGLITKDRSINVAALEAKISKIENVGLALTLVVIRRNTKSELVDLTGKSVYLGAKKAKPAKSLKGLQDRLAAFGLTTDDYEVISTSTQG